MATRRTSPAAELDDLPPAPRGADPDAWRVMVANGGGVVPAADPDADAEMDLGDRLRAAFGNGGAEGARVAIFRRDPRTKAKQWCIDYTPEQFMDGGAALLKEDFGPGAYEYRAFGKTGLITRGYVEIAEVARSNSQAPAPAVSNEISKALEMLAQGQAAIAQALTQRPDPMQDMQRTLALVASMREAFGISAAPAPAAAPVPSLLEQLQTLKALRDFAKGEADDDREPDPDNPLTYLAPVLQTLREGFTRGGASAGAGAVSPAVPLVSPPPSLQGPATAPPAPVAGTPEAGGDSPDGLAWRGIVAAAVALAEKGAPAEEGGRLLYETLPDDFIPYLQLPNWFEILSSMAPQLKPHRAWVEAAKIDADARFAAAR